MLSRKNKMVFMETNNISKKIQIKEISKISHKILVQLKYCENTLLRKLQVDRKHFPSSMMKSVLKTGRKIPNLKLITIFFFRPKQQDRISFTMATAAQSQVTRPYLNLHNPF